MNQSRTLNPVSDDDVRCAARGEFTMRGYNEAVLQDAAPHLLARAVAAEGRLVAAEDALRFYADRNSWYRMEWDSSGERWPAAMVDGGCVDEVPCNIKVHPDGPLDGHGWCDPCVARAALASVRPVREHPRCPHGKSAEECCGDGACCE